jgi:bacillithiol biosynthesis cysteine-adding enzyme BshC
VDAVPIFWLASEDHDLLEVNHVFLPDGEGQLRRLETASKGQPDSPVATVALSPDVADLLQQATELAGDSQAIDLVRAAYQPGRTFSEAFALLMTSVFSRSGLILLDPADAEFHRAGAPLLEQAAERTHEITESLLARNQELDAAGYHAQVNVTASSMLLFFLQNGARVPVHRKNCNFTVNGEQWNTAQLRKKIVDAPELFSANVLLRPVLQDFLLPTAAYIAGPAEAAYFAQAQVVYEHLLGRSTPVLPRFSATLIEPRLASWMRKYGLRLRDVLQPRDEFVNALARRTIPADLKEEFDRSNEHLDRLLAPLLRSLDRLDPSIGAAGDLAARKMRYQLKRLEARAARAHLRREEVLDRHAGLLSSILFPEKELQERKIAGIYFLARLGTDLVDTLVKEFRPECRDHQVTSVL